MQRVLQYIVIGALLGFCASSCHFLDEQILDSSTRDTYYKNAVQIESGLNGCYLPLRDIFKEYKYFYITEAQTDLMQMGSNGQYEAYCQYSTMNPQFCANLWTSLYRGVSRCNTMLNAIEKASIDENEKAPLRGEAVVLRAMFYYLLTCNFGDVPFYEEEVTDENNDRIARLPRMSASATRRALIEELRKQILEDKALPMYPTYSQTNPRQYRAGAAVGCMIGGKMCLWEGLWSEALDFFGALEEMYGPLSQYRLSDVAFRNRYTGESILEMGQTSTDYGYNVYGELACRCTPMRGSFDPDLDDEGDDTSDITEFDTSSDYYAEVGIPELGSTSRTNSPLRPTNHMYKDLMPYDSGDKRRHSCTAAGPVEDGGGWMQCGWFGYSQTDDRSVVKPHWLYFDGMAATSRPYLGDKFWCFGMQYKQDSNNFKIYRYAGAVLNMAEAHLMRGDEDQACAYLNQVRRRAGLPDVKPADFADADAFLAAIQDECARELFGEFNRKHDLVRWGIWWETIQKYGGSTLIKYARPCHRYCPIPQVQVTYSGGALDNDEYNQYGL